MSDGPVPNLPLLNAGIRKARLSDVDAVQSLLQPLEKEGVLVKRSRNELEAMMHDFIVIERETKVGIGCEDELETSS